MKKIDIHCHTSTRTIKDVPDGDASLQNILRYMDAHDIEKTVVLATYFPHKRTGVSNFRLAHWLSGRCSTMTDEGLGRFVMFGSLDFEHYFLQGFNELEEMASDGLIKGIKIYTGYQKIDIASSEFESVMKLALSYDLPVMFHAGYSYSSMRKYGKPSIEVGYSAESLRKVADRFPEVNMIFSHMSKPFFHEMLFAAKELPNVYTDMSGIIDSQHDEKEIPVCIQEIKLFLQECGPSKLLFGTDFPVQTHEHSVGFVWESMSRDFSKAEIEDVYYNNAARLLRVS